MKYGKHRKRQKQRKAGTSRASTETRQATGTGQSSETAQRQEGRLKLKPWWERWEGRLEYEMLNSNVMELSVSVMMKPSRRALLCLNCGSRLKAGQQFLS